MINIETNYGTITVELDLKGTPKTAENFLSYVKSGFYDNTIFHRVIDGFMVQGGGMDADMQSKANNPVIQNEASLGQKNKRGTLAMARTSDPHSASSQFFINVADNDFLNFRSETEAGWGYCVFGKVIAGMDVVDKIKAVATANRGGHQNVPVNSVVIERAVLCDASVDA
jgi:peptidyl-prolyl cis-trans isomerase B (cyclophilin B)